MAAENGDLVQIEYTGKLDNGEVFDSNVKGDPLAFRLGSGKVIKGFEKAILGMEEGAVKDVTIPPEEAYGTKKEELIQKAPRSALGKGEPEVGMLVQMEIPGQEYRIPATITEVTDAEITLDLNPPLAGKTLHFKIKLLELKKGE